MDSDEPLREIHVQPGEAHLIRKPGILCTLLGSCVGITFWVPRLRAGALCHPMLPHYSDKRCSRGDMTPHRYVDFVIPDLAAQFDAMGVTRMETEVKLFGGADVLEMSHSRPSVGTMNGQTALEVLKAEGYRVIASRLGGNKGMQIHFNTQNGEVLVRRFGALRSTKHPAEQHHRNRA